MSSTDLDMLLRELEGVRQVKLALDEREDTLLEAVWVMQFPTTITGQVLCDARLLHRICSFNSLKETYSVGMTSSLLLRNLIDGNGAWPLYQVDSRRIPLEPVNVNLAHLSALRIVSPVGSWMMTLLGKEARKGFSELTSAYLIEPSEAVMELLLFYATFLTTIAYKGEMSPSFRSLLSAHASTLVDLSLSLLGSCPEGYTLPKMANLLSLDIVNGPFELSPSQLGEVLESPRLECLYLAGVDLVEDEGVGRTGRPRMSCGEFIKASLESQRLMEVVLKWSDPTCLDRLSGDAPAWLTLASMRGSTLSQWRWLRITSTGVMAFQYGDPPDFAEKMFLQQYRDVDDGESLIRAEIRLGDLPADFYYQYIDDEKKKAVLGQIALRVAVAMADRHAERLSLAASEAVGDMSSSSPALNERAGTLAFNVLDTLHREGSLSRDEMEFYKVQYERLHKTITESYESEKELLQKGKDLNVELTKEMIKVEKASIEQADDAAAVGAMRASVKKIASEVQVSNEKEAMCVLQALEVSNDLVSVREDMADQEAYERALLEPQEEKMRKAVEELSEKLANGREEKEAIEDDIKKADEEVGKLRYRMGEERRGLRDAEEDFHRLRDDPERLGKEIGRNVEVLGMIRTAAEEERKEIAKAEKNIDKKEESMVEVRKEAKPLRMRIQTINDTIEVMNQGLTQIKVKLSNERERYMEEVSRKVGLDMQLRQCKDNFLHAQNEAARKDKHLYRAKRDTKQGMIKQERAEVALKATEGEIEEAVDLAEKIATDDKKQESLLEEVQAEVDIFMAAFMRQESMDHHKKMDYEGLLARLADQQKELQALGKAEASAKQRERFLISQREKLNRDTELVKKLCKQTLGEVQMKIAEEADQRRKLESCGMRQKECRSAYEIIKNERNKYLNLIQTASQRVSEMQEKYRMLNNEADVLQGESHAKGKAVEKAKAEAAKQRSIRDRLLSEYNKMNNKGHELNDEVERNVSDIDKLNYMINNLERKLEDIGEKYEATLEDRNFAGVELIDRNDELCVLWEKFNSLEGRTAKGSVAMLKLSEDIRQRTLAAGQLRGELDIIKKQLQVASTNAGIDRQGERALQSVGIHPSSVGSGPLMVGEADGAVVVEKMKEQLAALIEKSAMLSKELEDPNSVFRKWRELEGKVFRANDLDRDILAAKIRLLEERLNDKKETLVEKDMILEELEPLCSKVAAQVAEGKEEKLILMQKVNSLQQTLRDLTRKLISAVSELSMYQATALEGEGENRKLQALVDEAVERLRVGDVVEPVVPFPGESEVVLQRARRGEEVEHEYSQERQRKKKEKDEANDPNAVRSTAVPRVQQYVPEDGSIGLPRAYGVHAPFLPSEAGANMRHFRKLKRALCKVERYASVNKLVAMSHQASPGAGGGGSCGSATPPTTDLDSTSAGNHRKRLRHHQLTPAAVAGQAEALAKEFVHALPVGTVVICRMVELDQWRHGTVVSIRRRENLPEEQPLQQAGDHDYYVHFQRMNRRHDRWIKWEDLKLCDSSENSSESNGVSVPASLSLPVDDEYSDDSDHEGMGNEELESWEKATRVKRIQKIFFHKYIFDAWYWAPFPEEYQDLDILYFCEFCLKFFDKILDVLKTLNVKDQISIQMLSELTYIKEDDVVMTLTEYNILVYYKGNHHIALPPWKIKKLYKPPSENHLKIHPEFLHWVPLKLPAAEMIPS
ncbi:hypothetical protein FOZ61_004208 [Perkinsus olseni]|uniref:histone acetyltransferase n=1 Tax=Perkinsus olseni TaxID=32597 RepID=A0A7J6LMR1_PEROL|nr:hypothetical protein FOZ61_004208 [Perkinsus olseni]